VGARLAIEFVAFGAVATLAAGLELAIEIASGACICLDSWHFFRGSPDWQLLAEMPIERLTYVQLTDALVPISADAYHESTTRRTFCGQGELDIQRFVAALRTKATHTAMSTSTTPISIGPATTRRSRMGGPRRSMSCSPLNLTAGCGRTASARPRSWPAGDRRVPAYGARGNPDPDRAGQSGARAASQDPAQGAANAVWAALVADGDLVGGRYCQDCAVAPVTTDPAVTAGVLAHALDGVRAEQLWSLSERLLSAAGARRVR
jgi:hypothetical protein